MIIIIIIIISRLPRRRASPPTRLLLPLSLLIVVVVVVVVVVVYYRLQYNMLHYITLCYITLHYNTLHYMRRNRCQGFIRPVSPVKSNPPVAELQYPDLHLLHIKASSDLSPITFYTFPPRTPEEQCSRSAFVGKTKGAGYC